MFLNVILVLYVFLFLFTLVTSKKKEIANVISLELSYILRGLSILFIVLSHICQNISSHSLIQFPFLNYAYLFVALFFFLSGYGNFISISKTPKSIKWLVKRLLCLFIFFSFGLVVNIILNRNVYTSNSTLLYDFFSLTYRPYTLWYLKVLFIYYLLTFFSKLLFVKQNKQVFFLFMVTILYIIICILLGVPNYWWNSVIAFPMGGDLQYIRKISA